MYRMHSACEAIHETAKAVLAYREARKSRAMVKRCVSDKTAKQLKGRKNMSKRKNSATQFRQIRKQIKDQNLQDYKDWVGKCAGDMEAANAAAGNMRRIFQVVNHLVKKATPPPHNLTHEPSGALLKSLEEVANMWYGFSNKKFSATQKENDRSPLASLPLYRSTEDALTKEEFKLALRRLKCDKTAGPDGIPIEVFKYCNTAKYASFVFCNKYGRSEELIPQNFAQAKFVMLFKNKGSSKDPSKYRCIGLLNHSYKILSLIILRRLLQTSDGYLQDWQAGFRAGRGCRDNSLVLPEDSLRPGNGSRRGNSNNIY